MLYSMVLAEFPGKRKGVFPWGTISVRIIGVVGRAVPKGPQLARSSRSARKVVFRLGEAVRRLSFRQAASPRDTQRRRGIPYHTRLLARDLRLAGGAGNGCPDHTPWRRIRSRVGQDDPDSGPSSAPRRPASQGRRADRTFTVRHPMSALFGSYRRVVRFLGEPLPRILP